MQASNAAFVKLCCWCSVHTIQLRSSLQHSSKPHTCIWSFGFGRGTPTNDYKRLSHASIKCCLCQTLLLVFCAHHTIALQFTAFFEATYMHLVFWFRPRNTNKRLQEIEQCKHQMLPLSNFVVGVLCTPYNCAPVYSILRSHIHASGLLVQTGLFNVSIIHQNLTQTINKVFKAHNM